MQYLTFLGGVQLQLEALATATCQLQAVLTLHLRNIFIILKYII